MLEGDIMVKNKEAKEIVLCYKIWLDSNLEVMFSNPVLLWLQWDTKNERLLPDAISCYIFMRKDISCGSLIILQVGSKDWTIIMERKKKLRVSLQLRNLKWFNFQASKSTVIWPLLKGRSWSQLVLDSCLLLELCQQACGVLKTFPNQQMFEMYLFCQNVNMCYFSSCECTSPPSALCPRFPPISVLPF